MMEEIKNNIETKEEPQEQKINIEDFKNEIISHLLAYSKMEDNQAGGQTNPVNLQREGIDLTTNKPNETPDPEVEREPMNSQEGIIYPLNYAEERTSAMTLISPGVLDLYESCAKNMILDSKMGSSKPKANPKTKPCPPNVVPETQQKVDTRAKTAKRNRSLSTSERTTVVKKMKIRKYDESYIRFGFSYTYVNEILQPQCILCKRILSNDSMRPSKLKRHLITNHSKYQDKPREFFEDKLHNRDDSGEPRQEPLMANPPPTKEMPFSKRALMASYLVSLRIAKCKQAHVVGRTLIQPAAVDMCEKILGKDAADQVKTIPLSNTTVRRRIGDLAQDVKRQLIENVQRSPYFALLIDETLDIANSVQVFCYVRYTSDTEVMEDLLFYKDIPPPTSDQEIFDLLNEFMIIEGLDWSKCVAIHTDGSSTLTGEHTNFIHFVQQVALNAKWYYCFIHRDALAAKHLQPSVHEAMNLAVKVVAYIKSQSANSICMRLLNNEIGEYRPLLINAEIRWLSRKNILQCLFTNREEVKTALQKTDHFRDFCEPAFLAHLAYLSYLVEEVNTCYGTLEGSRSTVVDLKNKMNELINKLDTWKNKMDSENTKDFPLLDEFLSELGNRNLSVPILNSISAHLSALKDQLQHNFSNVCHSDNDWVHHPFSVSVESIDHLPIRVQEDFIDLFCNRSIQLAFSGERITQIWVKLKEKFPVVCDEALKIITPFAAPQLSEEGFLDMAAMKSKQRNRLVIACDLRLCLTTIEPDIQKLCSERQAQPSH